MLRFQRYLTPLLICLSVAACKKGDPGGDPAVNASPLIPASTGWEKAGTVKSTYTNAGFPNQNSMQPIELMKVGSTMQVLYTENYEITGTHARILYKGQYALGSSDTAQVTKLPGTAGGDESTYTGLLMPHFIPESYSVMSLKYFTNGAPNKYLGILDEGAHLVSTHGVGHPGRAPKIYSNGDVLDGVVNYATNAEMDYYNKASNTWKFLNQTSHDTVLLDDYRPFRLPDGTLLAFTIMYKGGKAYLGIADPDFAAAYPNLTYRSRFLQEMPELAADFTQILAPYLISYIQDGASITVVIGTYASATGSQHATKLFAYKWTAGSSSFATLYAGVPITGTLDAQLAGGACRPDGTVYVWAPDPSGNAAALITADAAGVHRLGVTGNTGVYQIGAVTAIDGVYYGVAYPVSDAYDTDHNLHMDIIRLKQ